MSNYELNSLMKEVKEFDEINPSQAVLDMLSCPYINQWGVDFDLEFVDLLF